MYISDGFNTVTPYFFVHDAERFVKFLQAAFGGEELGRSKRPDGKIANTQIRIGTSVLMSRAIRPWLGMDQLRRGSPCASHARKSARIAVPSSWPVG